MGRRPLRVAAWLAFACAELSLHLWRGHTVALYSVFIMLTTTGGVVLHAIAALRSTGHARRVWTITAIGLACWAYSEISVGVPAVLTGTAPPRSAVANVLTLGALVFAVSAMLAIPTAPRALTGKLRMLCDGLIAASALMGSAWMLVLKPLTRVETLSDALVDLSYPIVAAGVLAVGLVLLAGQPLRQRNAMTAITGSVVVLTVILLLEVAENAVGLPWLRPYVLGGYVCAALLMALSSRAPLPTGGERAWRPSTAIGSALPYVPVVAFAGVGLGFVITGRPLDTEVIIAGVTMVAAVFGRQFLELRLNAALTRELADERGRYAAEAAHDSLTGLPNRGALTRALAKPGPAAMLLIDLDGFKAVNDTLGHGAGDELLAVVADRLRTVTGSAAVPARLGGDEFAVLLPGGGIAAAEAMARAVLVALGEPVTLAGFPAAVSASIGVAACGDAPAVRLLHEADLALYDAKSRGKGIYRIFDRALSAQVEERRRLQAELARAVGEGQLAVLYQPIVDLTTGESHACEALVRWDHPERGQLPPDTFLPAAQDAGLLAEIDRWVLGTAAAQLAAWRAVDPAYAVAVNLSVSYLVSGRVVDDVRAVLARHDLPGSALTVEVTETSLIADLAAAARTLAELRALGVRVALDDFGVGYSSLTYLRTLPVDIVKIDRSFIRELDQDPQAAVLVEAVLALARGLNLSCVAEGVELASQVSRLRALQCGRAQGYLFARPQPAAEVRLHQVAVLTA
jgi:diguanylate cyclase (GGDEF)-like protein